MLIDAAANKTGAAINPARALGPTFVFQCNWNEVWVYVLAELAGASCLVGTGTSCALCMLNRQREMFSPEELQE